jgi:hypothetical protein
MCTKTCHRRIAYSNLDCKYEMQSSDVMRLWICVCGDVLRMDNMSDLAMVYETRKGNYGQ